MQHLSCSSAADYLETDESEVITMLSGINAALAGHVAKERYFTDDMPCLPAVQEVQFCSSVDCEILKNFILPENRSMILVIPEFGWINNTKTKEPVWRKR